MGNVHQIGRKQPNAQETAVVHIADLSVLPSDVCRLVRMKTMLKRFTEEELVNMREDIDLEMKHREKP